MREITEISDTELEIGYNDFSEIGSLPRDVIRFINNCFDVCVTRVDSDLTKCKIRFTMEKPSLQQAQIQSNIEGQTDFWVLFRRRDYMILWKKTKRAESYHTATGEDELREQYRNRTAILCNEKNNTEWEIDRITPV